MSVLLDSFYFGIVISVVTYWAATWLQKKTGLVVCNNLLVASLMIVALLKIFDIPYESFNKGASFINTMLGPATACLAVTIYNKIDLLKKYWLPVLAGCTVGVVTSVGCILVMCRLFGLERSLTVSLLPKSVTTPIATAVAGANGGIVSISVAAVIFTGILGNLIAPLLIKIFRVKEPMAIGLGLGASAHAMGTARALEIGQTEGAMSGLAMGLCGLITAVAALLFPILIP